MFVFFKSGRVKPGINLTGINLTGINLTGINLLANAKVIPRAK